MLSYRLAADAMLFVHLAFVAFVVISFLLTAVGLLRRWNWVRNFWFRAGHLLAIAIVVIESWMDQTCPLTMWENELRMRGGDATYPGDFLVYWAARLLYYQAEPWVFTVCYSVFGGAVALTWLLGPPRWPWSSQRRATPSTAAAADAR